MTVQSGNASFVNARYVRPGNYTDFAPPNLLLATLGILVGTQINPTDNQSPGLRARPWASDFTPPNLLLSVYFALKPPTLPADVSATHVKARSPATDFNPPNLLGRFLGPAPVASVDLMGDPWSRGKSSRPGIYGDVITPNLILTLPPPLTGPYVPVEVGVDMLWRNNHKEFAPPNVLLNTLGLIGAGQSFRGITYEGHPVRKWSTTDFNAPNLTLSSLQLLAKAPIQPQEYSGFAARTILRDFPPPNLLTGTFKLFLGNPPKTIADPYVYALRKPAVYDDTVPANYLTGPSSHVISAPLSALDDGLKGWRSPFLSSDFIAPNLFAGLLVAAAPPLPPSPIVVPSPGVQALPYTFPDPATAYRRISEVVNQLLQGKSTSVGRYQSAFGSGPVQYAGPSGQLAGSDNLIFGLNLPNPAGTPGAALLAGSGGGNGSNVSFWFITDQAFDTLSPGNDIFHTAGETQPGSSARGGNWTVIAGASDLGPGGQATIQGGTSVKGPAGITVVQGGNNTEGNLPAGDIFIIGGQEGSQGASVHLIPTQINGISGFIRHRVNSTIRWDEYPGDGSWFFYDGSGFGQAGASVISHGPGQPVGFATDGADGTFTSQDGKTITVTKGRITKIQ